MSMIHSFLIALFLCISIPFSGSLAQNVPTATVVSDVPYGRDHPMLKRFESTFIVAYNRNELERVVLFSNPVAPDFSGKTLPIASSMVVDGTSYVIAYRGNAETSPRSIANFYKAQLNDAGFETLFECMHAECTSGGANFNYLGSLLQARPFNVGDLDSKQIFYRLSRLVEPDRDIYVSTLIGYGARGPAITLRIVETKPHALDKSAIMEAEAIDANISTAGKAVLYGILFATGKAEISPLSKEPLNEIADYLKSNPAVRLVVTGHTDSRGDFAHNVSLSEQRAQAVVKTLVENYAIDPARLVAFGAGMSAPVASNETEAGRARNRRVELVRF